MVIIRTTYGDKQIVIHGEETGRLSLIEIEYLERFDGVVVNLQMDGEYPKLVISAE